MKKESFITLSLSAEELALAFGMTNHPDLGRRLLNSIAPNQTEQQLDARMTAASHSLGARGLVNITSKQVPVLSDAVENALFPIVRFDRLLQVMRATETSQLISTIYIQDKNKYTAHRTDRGVIHVLDTGETKNLTDYLGQIFNMVNEKGGDRAIPAKHKLSLGELGKVMKARKNGGDLAKMLADAGLSKEASSQLGGDIRDQVMRGSVISLEISSNNPLEAARGSARETLLILQGDERCWLFETPTAKDEEIVRITTVSRKSLLDRLNEFSKKPA